MRFFPVQLGWIAFAFVTIFLLGGVGLAVAGVTVLLDDHLVGGVTAVVAGGGIAGYGVKVAMDARHARFADWIRDIPHCPP